MSSQQKRLFGRFSVSEQQHSYRVYAALKQSGEDDPDLLAAALLHDVGKTTMPRSWWDRPVVVLGQAFLPGKAAVWSKGDVTRFTRPFVVKARHAGWGASLAEEAGSSAKTVALIRSHDQPPPAEMDDKWIAQLALLRWADDRS
ncbi:MAG: HD domain-containing protein [Candidatus Promineifilaceae bacterium]